MESVGEGKVLRLGHYGNGASIEEVRWLAGISAGTVIDFTDCCLKVIESLKNVFIQQLTSAEKEVEKKWIENELGFKGSSWREGWVMYDGTIVVLYRKPGQNGDAYYT